MGLLADFYIAEKANAALYSETQECDEADRVQSGDITTLQLSMLAAVLEGREWQVEMMDAFEQILVDGDGEQTIFQVSPALIERLATLNLEAVRKAAEDCAQLEDFACEAEDLQPLFAELVQLSARARASGRHVFLWNCV